MASRPQLNREFEIPGLAGYSKDGRTIYVDRRLPRELTLRDGTRIDLDRYLYVHELTEWHWEHREGLVYREAHRKATEAERKAVEADGLQWDQYERYMLAQAHKLRVSKGPLPSDFDTKPQLDRGEKKQAETLMQRMSAPKGK